MISNCNHRFFAFLLFIFLLSIHPHSSLAQAGNPLRNPIVIQVIHLNYADAEHLASVLAPLLSKEGVIVPYAPTNTLIIKDRKSVVKGLGKLIKGTAEPQGNFLDYQTDPEESHCLPR
ncbi:MAG: hypothetical protein KAU38_17480 [Desulfobacterales bacterium]|nr:hypothetical protein [Desulfobacterales bacterium]